MADGLWALNVAHYRGSIHYRGTMACECRVGADKVTWKADIKWCYALQVLDLLVGQFDAECLDVVLQMRDLAAAHDWEYIWCL